MFISYSWRSSSEAQRDPEQARRVHELVAQLAEQGIDTICDLHDLHVGDDVYEYMERSVKEESVTHVLFLCDQSYQQKFDGNSGGAGIEGSILRPHIFQELQEKRENKKFVAVVWERGENNEPFIPVALQGKFHVDLSSPPIFPEQFDRLCHHLYNRALYPKPLLGPVPLEFQDPVAEYPVRTAGLLRALKRQAYNGNAMGMKLYLTAYLNALAGMLVDLKVPDSEDPPRALVNTIREQHPYLLEWADFLCFAFGSEVEIITLGHLCRFLEEVLGYQKGTERQQSFLFMGTPTTNAQAFFIRQIFVLVVATQVKYRRWDNLKRLLKRMYAFEMFPGDRETQPRLDDYTGFACHMNSLPGKPEHKNKMHGQVLAGLPEHPILTFHDLADTDGILYFYSLVKELPQKWFPRELEARKPTNRFFMRARRPPGQRWILEQLDVSPAEVFTLNKKLPQLVGVEASDFWSEYFNVSALLEP